MHCSGATVVQTRQRETDVVVSFTEGVHTVYLEETVGHCLKRFAESGPSKREFQTAVAVIAVPPSAHPGGQLAA
jgi:hypothetical protein